MGYTVVNSKGMDAATGDATMKTRTIRCKPSKAARELLKGRGEEVPRLERPGVIELEPDDFEGAGDLVKGTSYRAFHAANLGIATKVQISMKDNFDARLGIEKEGSVSDEETGPTVEA